MHDTAELTHCYFLATEALLAGKDPLEAAAHHLRADGVLTFADRLIANRAVEAARRDTARPLINLSAAAE